MDEDGYFPTFERSEDGQYYVSWRGHRWGLLTPPQDDWEFRAYRDHVVKISFSMVHLPGEPKPNKSKINLCQDDGIKEAAVTRDELLAFATWLLEGESGEGREEQIVDKYLAETKKGST